MDADQFSMYLPMDRRQALARGEDLPAQCEGAALFADISGFTPLTEALVKELGAKRGAEELTNQLNQIYDALILEVNRYRGAVIGFGGDAITCWFDGQTDTRAAARRAVACGLAMQQAMTPFAAVATPAGGVVSLAMKAAIAAGPARRFLVGDPRIQQMDVLAGSTLDRMAAAEKHAQRGEVVVEAKTLELLGLEVQIAEWRDAHQYAVVAGLATPLTPTPWPPFAAPFAEAQLRPWLLPPVYDRLKYGQAQFLAEIRPTVVLFLKFAGLDYDHDEAVGEKLNAYMRWAQNVVEPYEGYLLQLIMGDKGSYFYAAFGAPVAHDDDPDRAVAAALKLSHPPDDLKFIRDVQVGITQGRIWAGAYGGATRRTYGVLGDDVNLAARLMAKAEPGQILITQNVAEIVARHYHLQPIGQVAVKGKLEPVAVSQVLEQRSASGQRAIAMYSSPLVGREPELARMADLLQRAISGTGQILRLEGGTGLGKSYLVMEFAVRAIDRDVRVVVGACQSTSQDIAYAPWKQIFRALFNIQTNNDEALTEVSQEQAELAQVEAEINRLNASWLLRLPLLADLLDLAIPDNTTTATFDARLRQEALFAFAVDLLQAWAQEQPLLMVLEDAHWLDEASESLTIALSRVVAKSPLMLLVVHRPALDRRQPILPELGRAAHQQYLNLNELSLEGIAELVTYRLEGSPSALLLSLIQAQAQGNPFFTEELLTNLVEANFLQRTPTGLWTLTEAMITALLEAKCLVRSTDTQQGDWLLAPNAQISQALALPTSIHGVVLSRLDRLPETQKLTIKVASVIGRIFEVNLLNRAHPGHPERGVLLGQVRALEDRDFTRLEVPPPHLAYMFKHNVTQEVAYETLLEAQQRELHRIVGIVLETLEPEAVEQLAYHFTRGQVPDKAMVYLDQAARKAQDEYANETALSYYLQALALEERWEWRRGQIEALHILGRREEELVALHALEALPSAPLFGVQYLFGQYYEAVGDYAHANEAFQVALADGQHRADQLGEVRCLAQLGLIARRQGNYDAARQWYEKALALLQNQTVYSNDEAYALVQALNGLGTVQRQQGNFERATESYERALSLSRERGNRRGEADVLNSLGVTMYYQHDFGRALAYHKQTLQIRREFGDRAGVGTSLYNIAATSLDMGDYSLALEFFSEALTIQQAVGNRWEEVNVWNGLGALYLLCVGDLAQAQKCLEQGLMLSREIGDEAGQVYLLSNLGLVMRDSGDLSHAEQLLSEGLNLARLQNDAYQEALCLSYLSSVTLLHDKLSEAEAQASLALTKRQELGLNLLITADLATLADIYLKRGELAQATAYATQAFDILIQCQGEGPEFPQRDFFICYRVFLAHHLESQATRALHAARDLILSRAQKITDPALRQSFLENVLSNREVLLAAQPT